MAANPEEQAREEIDRLLGAAGWAVQDYKAVDLRAARGVNPGEHVHKDRFVIFDCVGVCERDKSRVEYERVSPPRNQNAAPAVALRGRAASMRLAA